MGDENIHSYHRKRLRERYLEHGLDNFHDHNVMELLLMFAIPRKDVNPLAHALIVRFGSLDAIFDAPIEELTAVPGIGNSAATLINLIPQISKRYMTSKGQRQDTIKNSVDAGNYIVPRYMYERDEVAAVLCLDSMQRAICYRELSRGVVNVTEISIRKIIETALSCNAVSVILAHNHPDGAAYPSVEDQQTTAQIFQALEVVGIELCDHIIVAGNDYASMADCGMIGRQMGK